MPHTVWGPERAGGSRAATHAMFGTLGGGGPDAQMQAQAQARRAEHEFAYFSSRLPYARRAAGCADEKATAVRKRAREKRSRHPA